MKNYSKKRSSPENKKIQYNKLKTWGWRDGLEIKSTCYSGNRPGFGARIYRVAHDHL